MQRTSISVGTEELATYDHNPRNGKLLQVNFGNGQKVRFEYDCPQEFL